MEENSSQENEINETISNICMLSSLARILIELIQERDAFEIQDYDLIAYVIIMQKMIDEQKCKIAGFKNNLYEN